MTAFTVLWQRPDFRRAAGLGLLLAAFAVGALTVGFGSFSDEGDKLAIGLYLLRGSQLYRDLFSHHLPFAHYWSAGALALLGPTVLSVRLSVLFAQVIVFALLMRLTRLYLPLGLAAIAWEASRHLYLGQMATYNTLGALALAVIFVCTYIVLTRRQAARRELVLIGLAGGILALCDPIAVLAAAVAITLGCLARDGLRRAATIGLAAGGMLALYGGWLLLSGTLPDFHREVVVFNTEVYSQFAEVSLGQTVQIAFYFARSTLGIYSPGDWTGPAMLNPSVPLAPAAQWLFGGLLQRLAFLLLAVACLARRQFLAALFVYLFGAALLTRADTYIRLPGLALVSILVMALLAPRAWQAAARAPAGVRLAVRGLLAFLLVWPIVLGLGSLAPHLGSLSYGVNFRGYTALAAEIEALTCGRPAALGYYPGDPNIYFFSDLKPVSRYLYMWPWVAQVALDDEISRLSQGEAIVRLAPVESVWGYPTEAYLAKLIAHVQTNFVPAPNHFYLSPALAVQCPPP